MRRLEFDSNSGTCGADKAAPRDDLSPPRGIAAQCRAAMPLMAGQGISRQRSGDRAANVLLVGVLALHRESKGPPDRRAFCVSMRRRYFQSRTSTKCPAKI